MQELFRDDSYLKRCHATVTGISDAGITFDRSVFYALGGGQLGDTGTINTSDGRSIRTTDTVKDKVSGAHLHVIESSESSPAGTAAGQATKSQ